eukprot:CAMPEP_0119127440 /NCGR_PEP_ID=MMETSP1310-20130426/5992_1 /TAXON_ID=464262 /ORGANISM="Genus nov. species nov., Strain RCC2339" /LENGTH=260 /DNA_ID=CAMNT_0007117699 /DNA_START=62 /DNA_END=844 /DNA_ORIENTATION=+
MPPRIDVLPFETLAQYFNLPIKDAMHALGISAPTLKKMTRYYCITRWPHRKLQSIERTIQKLRMTRCGSQAELDRCHKKIERLEAKRMAIMRGDFCRERPAGPSVSARTRGDSGAVAAISHLAGLSSDSGSSFSDSCSPVSSPHASPVARCYSSTAVHHDPSPPPPIVLAPSGRYAPVYIPRPAPAPAPGSAYFPPPLTAALPHIVGGAYPAAPPQYAPADRSLPGYGCHNRMAMGDCFSLAYAPHVISSRAALELIMQP